jgi:Cu/Ag efflux pump CusA
VPITAGIREIVVTLFQAVALVILVVYIFLQNARSTLIPTLTVPVSLIGAFMVFPLLGFTINTLSLLGLVLAIGIVVDDAIVVVEAVAAKMEKGQRGYDRGHARGIRAHCGDLAGTDRGVRAGSCHGWHYRQVVPAVCHHHRHRGGDILHQCSYP